VVGCLLELSSRSGYGRLLVLDGAVPLGAVLFWHGCQLRDSTLIGFLTGAMVPVACGNYAIASSIAYLNANPGTFACGTSMMGAQFLIVIGGPICGAVGMVVAATIAAICRAMSPATP
jgi:hypothetical protein